MYKVERVDRIESMNGFTFHVEKGTMPEELTTLYAEKEGRYYRVDESLNLYFIYASENAFIPITLIEYINKGYCDQTQAKRLLMREAYELILEETIENNY